jgi:hypothetical protein
MLQYGPARTRETSSTVSPSKAGLAFFCGSVACCVTGAFLFNVYEVSLTHGSFAANVSLLINALD